VHDSAKSAKMGTGNVSHFEIECLQQKVRGEWNVWNVWNVGRCGVWRVR
jgi:hypothetical protein